MDAAETQSSHGRGAASPRGGLVCGRWPCTLHSGSLAATPRSDSTRNDVKTPAAPGPFASASTSAARSPISSCSTGANDRIRLHKYLTTPEDPSVGALAGLGELIAAEGIDARPGRRDHPRHDPGHQRGDRAARRSARADHHAGHARHPRARRRAALRHLRPVPRLPGAAGAARPRLEVAGARDRDGRVAVPLDEAAVARAVETLAAEGVEALAICFLHSYRNPDHERARRRDRAPAPARARGLALGRGGRRSCASTRAR